MSLVADGDLSGVASVLAWSAVLLGIILVAFFAYSQFKRWMYEPDQEVSAGFTLSDLRELHRQGKLSVQEFETAKAKMVASAKKMTEKLPGASPDRTKPSKNMSAESGSEQVP